MTSASTDELYTTLRTRILMYADTLGVTNNSIVAGRLYRIAAPDDVQVPYGVLRLTNVQRVSGSGGLRLSADLECTWYGRPRKVQPIVESLGDRTVQALGTWRDTSDGFMRVPDPVSESLPAFNAPADRELVQVRVTGHYLAYPQFLTSL